MKDAGRRLRRAAGMAAISSIRQNAFAELAVEQSQNADSVAAELLVGHKACKQLGMGEHEVDRVAQACWDVGAHELQNRHIGLRTRLRTGCLTVWRIISSHHRAVDQARLGSNGHETGL